MEDRATISSDVYNHTFYGILNKDGQFWTPAPFHNKEAALAYLKRFSIGDYSAMLQTHRIVPVRIQLTHIADPDQPIKE